MEHAVESLVRVCACVPRAGQDSEVWEANIVKNLFKCDMMMISLTLFIFMLCFTLIGIIRFSICKQTFQYLFALSC